jgi:hypothetical protein
VQRILWKPYENDIKAALEDSEHQKTRLDRVFTVARDRSWCIRNRLLQDPVISSGTCRWSAGALERWSAGAL